MITLRRILATAVTAAAVAAIAATSSGAPTPSANWVCVYVDHVHATVCQDKPIDLFPESVELGTQT